MKTLIIAEKPDQARSFYLPLLERISGESFQKKQGYFESASYFLSWFFGHLFEALKPEEYDEKYKVWRMEDLPIIPDTLVYRYKNGTENQGHQILKLANASDLIICGTDPDREGQGIFDTFIKYYKLDKKPIKRLWATSLTDSDLKIAWSRMKDYKEYKNLSTARELRADSDWLVGMNASRAYSIITNSRMPIGRVLTATLALIVKRDLEVENYKETFFYQLKGTWDNLIFTYYRDNESKFDDQSSLKSLLPVIRKNQFRLTDSSQDLKIVNPPKPFNLPDLQKEANKRFGFSLDKTLKIAQELYEKKLTTYPRTDSPYLPESDLDAYHQLVRKFASSEQLALLRNPSEKPPCVKNTDSPHTALIITGEKPGSLTEDQSKIYSLILDRFITSFMIPCEFIEYSLSISDDDSHLFKSRVKKTLNHGFKRVCNLKEDDDDDNQIAEVDTIDEQRLRSLIDCIKNPEVIQTKKAKPKYYTPATLITAMQTCGRSLEDERYKKILSEVKGIGTPATQATYPDNLKSYDYIIEEKGHFKSTAKGRGLIAALSSSLKSPELTADWEMKLRLVESGVLSVYDYRKELRIFVKSIIDEASGKSGSIKINSLEDTGLLCPVCSKRIVKSSKTFSCEDQRCTFVIYIEQFGKQLTDKNMEELVTKKTTGLIRGFRKKDGTGTYDAKLILNTDYKIQLSFDTTTEHTCPLCSEKFEIFKGNYRCRGCGFTIYETYFSKKLNNAHIISLITKGKTPKISGFKSVKNDKLFDAFLVIDKPSKKIVLEFEKNS